MVFWPIGQLVTVGAQDVTVITSVAVIVLVVIGVLEFVTGATCDVLDGAVEDVGTEVELEIGQYVVYV